MKKVISTERIPIKLWLDNIEEGALVQAKNVANLPFAYKHVAIMPDAHQGYGVPIGGVFAGNKVVIPNAVGVDIGCGICAVKTDLTSNQFNDYDLRGIQTWIKDEIPVGVGQQNNTPQGEMPFVDAGNVLTHGTVVYKELEKAKLQLGSLGAGNHFIEIQSGSDNHIWLMIHSGSRNLGYTVAKHYNKQAIYHNTQWYSSVPIKHELAFLPIEHEDAKIYMEEMQYCVSFALANRKVMMEKVIRIINDAGEKHVASMDDSMINIAHNYAAWENHYGKNVIVHRKGATSARAGQMGIIPGSMGTSSYIVRGLGNLESFNSCSHGAGRAMGRKAAKRNLSLDTEEKRMEGIVHDMRSVDKLDEAPGAYKPIDEVMKNQEDLVEILVELTPLAVVKG